MSFNWAVCCLSVWDKREFQTALISAFIGLHYCVLDFFESFLHQDKKDSPRGGEQNIVRKGSRARGFRLKYALAQAFRPHETM